ncbi:MAG: NUDIX domain-containing protein [Anaerolineales bacterium]
MSDELLDIVNDKDVVIAQELRSTVHRLGLQHRGVHVFLVTPQGKLLVQQRGRQQETFPLALDCSVSEHVKAGEKYQQAADRGLLEELGINFVHIHPLIKFKMVYGPNDFEMCVLYEGRVDPAQVCFNPLEVNGIAWYDLEELEALFQGGKTAFSGWFVQLLNWYLRKPSELKILRCYKHDRLLLPMSKKRQ